MRDQNLGVIVYVWFDPYLTLVLPNGEIVPPIPAEDVMVYVFRLKVALTVVLLFMVTEQVVDVPEHAPDHPANVEPVPALAVRVTTVPALKLLPVGFVVIVPVPVPAVEVVSV